MQIPRANKVKNNVSNNCLSLTAGRRYTVQGLDLYRPRPPSIYGEDFLDPRSNMGPKYGVLPEDLMSVYRSMNKDVRISQF